MLSDHYDDIPVRNIKNKRQDTTGRGRFGNRKVLNNLCLLNANASIKIIITLGYMNILYIIKGVISIRI